MIVTKLIGGLGNQMFQYAAGKALAAKRNVPLKVDTFDLNKNPNGAYTKRNLELSIFNLNLEIANQQDIEAFNKNKFQNFLIQKLNLPSNKLVANERGSAYNKGFSNFPARTYLNGFWQSELYFKDISNILLKAFTIKEEFIKNTFTHLDELKQNSVSMHIRRGDYVNLKSANDFHGICSLDYYQAAIDLLKSKIGESKIYVFSDDIDWCKKNFTSEYFIFLDTKSAAEDLFLMSKCKHNIIANSSFSWWGAWLNQNPQKIVIAPKYWFTNVESKSIDILPQNWIAL